MDPSAAAMYRLQMKITSDHRAAFRRAESRLRSAADEGVEQQGREVLKAYRRLIPKKTRALYKSTFLRVRGTSGNKAATVGATAAHALYVERGTRPHVIRPKSARALRFTVGGQVVFARRVNHPGTKAQRPLAQAADRQRGVPRIRKVLQGTRYR